MKYVRKLFGKKTPRELIRRETGETERYDIYRSRQIPNLNPDNGGSLLHLAVENGDVYGVQELIDSGEYVNHEDNSGQTPLHIAIRKDNVDIMKKLIAAGANIEPKIGSPSLLNFAARYGSLDSVKELIKAGLSVNYGGFDEKSPLHNASENCHIDAERATTIAIGHRNRSSLFSAVDEERSVERGYVDVVMALINSGAEIDEKDRGGETPLYKALLSGSNDTKESLATSHKIAAILLLYGADTAEFAKMNNPPLQTNLKAAQELLLSTKMGFAKDNAYNFALGKHKRVGAESSVNNIPDDLIRLIAGHIARGTRDPDNSILHPTVKNAIAEKLIGQTTEKSRNPQ